MQRATVLVLLVTYVSAMEMRETVERMVMVRTTGSDLQPAATGFIYKKESDSPASVVKLGESEVVKQLSKMYEQPNSFAAPIPVAQGPFHAREEDNKSAALSSESKIIPVEEKEYEKPQVDGIADEDFKKMFEYASDLGNYNSDFDDYLKTIGYSDDVNLYDGNVHHKNDHGEEQDAKTPYGKEDGEDYSGKYENFKILKESDLKNIYADEPQYGHIHKPNDYTGRKFKLYNEDATDDSYKLLYNNNDDTKYISPDFNDHDSGRRDTAESQLYDDGFRMYSDMRDGSSYGYKISH